MKAPQAIGISSQRVIYETAQRIVKHWKFIGALIIAEEFVQALVYHVLRHTSLSITERQLQTFTDVIQNFFGVMGVADVTAPLFLFIVLFLLDALLYFLIISVIFPQLRTSETFTVRSVVRYCCNFMVLFLTPIIIGNLFQSFFLDSDKEFFSELQSFFTALPIFGYFMYRLFTVFAPFELMKSKATLLMVVKRSAQKVKKYFTIVAMVGIFLYSLFEGLLSRFADKPFFGFLYFIIWICSFGSIYSLIANLEHRNS